jgi:hypothetical protein
MTITYGELTDRVLHILDGFDVDGETPSGEVSDGAMQNAVYSALDAILPWAPKTAVDTLTADSSTTVFDLPSDFYEEEAFADSSSGEVYPQVQLTPGSFVGTNAAENNSWTLFPDKQVTFSKAPSDNITLYYLATWEKPSDPTDVTALEPPDFVMTGLALYAAAMIVLTGAVSITQIRQFNTRADSGNPEHNPMQEATNYLLRLFNAEMNRHPRYQKAM